MVKTYPAISAVIFAPRRDRPPHKDRARLASTAPDTGVAMSVSWVALVVSRPCGMGSDVAAALMEVGWRRWVTGTGAVAVGVVAEMFRSLRRLRAGCRTSHGCTPRAWPGEHVKAEPGKNAYVFEEVNVLGAPSRLCKLPIAMRGGARGDDEGDQQQGGEARGKAEDQSDRHEHLNGDRGGRPYGDAQWECSPL